MSRQSDARLVQHVMVRLMNEIDSIKLDIGQARTITVGIPSDEHITEDVRLSMFANSITSQLQADGYWVASVKIITTFSEERVQQDVQVSFASNP